MVKYTCPTCHKIFPRKSQYDFHINRKYPCKPLINENTDKLNDSSNEHEHDDNKNDTKYDILIKKIEKLEKDVKDLKKENAKLVNNTNSNNMNNNNNNSNNTNNNNTTNNTMNILVMPKAFGTEDYDFIIDDATSRKILNKGFMSIPELIKNVHFNELKPEYQNLLMSNWRDKVRILINDGKKWNLGKTEAVVDELRDKGIEFIQKKYKELDKKNKDDAKIIQKVSRFIESYNLEEKDKIDTLNEDIRLVLYNNRDIPEKTRKAITSATKKTKN